MNESLSGFKASQPAVNLQEVPVGGRNLFPAGGDVQAVEAEISRGDFGGIVPVGSVEEEG
ncbi:MAG: hypothetical protein H8E68_05880, partial [Kiritimatiellaeota bacterium]|nr:hypothetical protein [Kiritimatiellota bacterium]